MPDNDALKTTVKIGPKEKGILRFFKALLAVSNAFLRFVRGAWHVIGSVSSAFWNSWAVKKARQNTDWLVGLIVVLLLFSLAGTKTLRALEWQAYDFSVWASPTKPANRNIVVVGIDDKSIKDIGAWPWSRYILADVNARIAMGGAKVTGYLPSFDEPQNSRGIEILEELRTKHAKAVGKKALKLLKRAQRRIDTDHVLAKTFENNNIEVLAMPYHTMMSVPETLPTLPRPVRENLIRHELENPNHLLDSLPAFLRPEQITHLDRLHLPVAKIQKSANALSLGFEKPQARQFIRTVPLAQAYGNKLLPQFPLVLAAKYMGVGTAAITVNAEHQLTLNNKLVVTDKALRAYPVFYKSVEGQTPFTYVSFSDVYRQLVSPDVFKNKLVLVGMATPDLAEPMGSPIGDQLMPVIATAHIVSSLLNNDLYIVPDWLLDARATVFFIIALYLMFLLPRLRLLTGLLLSGLLLIGMLNAQFFLMILQSTWFPLMLPALVLVLGHVLLLFKQFLQSRSNAFQTELSGANYLLGVSFQSQGQLDRASRRLRRCELNEKVMEQLYDLGLDFERKRRFSKAAEVFTHIAESKPRYRDIQDRIARNDQMQNQFLMTGSDRRGGGHTLMAGLDDLEKPMLGRYQIDSELGKGAMGVVYLGRDPKIGRTVAIKTMSLADEFADDDLADVKARFLREAETAGRLNHPNIVTIYDVGEESDLAYIAMDYLEGKSVDAYTAADTLLPMEIVCHLIIQVADALDVAHSANVVHRDIKPANIIYNRKKNTATVTDFGIACLTDVSKTKTGTILGTPSYMSPEQLKGAKVDGRSDLFSLGTMLYQLLSGSLPFQGESMSSLMYKITHVPHENILTIRPDLPPCLSRIINKLLQKEAEKRYATGRDLMDALKNCLMNMHNK